MQIYRNLVYSWSLAQAVQQVASILANPRQVAEQGFTPEDNSHALLLPGSFASQRGLHYTFCRLWLPTLHFWQGNQKRRGLTGR